MDGKTWLAHYGVPGMRWRRRKGKSSSASPHSMSADAQKKSLLKRKKVSEMSNEELQALTKRMQLEQQYKTLKANEISAGKKFVQKVLVQSATTVASAFVTKAMTKGIDEVFKGAVKKKPTINIPKAPKPGSIGFKP